MYFVCRPKFDLHCLGRRGIILFVAELTARTRLVQMWPHRLAALDVTLSR